MPKIFEAMSTLKADVWTNFGFKVNKGNRGFIKQMQSSNNARFLLAEMIIQPTGVFTCNNTVLYCVKLYQIVLNCIERDL